jgi:hypothetical protein
VATHIQNHTFVNLSRGADQRMGNFGLVSIGGSIGYDQIHLETGYLLGYRLLKSKSYNPTNNPKGIYLRGKWQFYSGNRAKFGIGYDVAACKYTAEIIVKSSAIEKPRIIEFRNFLGFCDWYLNYKLYLSTEIHFGSYYDYDLNSSYNGYQYRNVGLNIGLKWKFF